MQETPIPGSGRSTGEGIGYTLQYSWASPVAQLVKNLPVMWETWVWSLCWEEPLEKGTAGHCSILAWRIPWTEEPGGLPSMGSHRVSHGWSDLAAAAGFLSFSTIDIWVLVSFDVGSVLYIEGHLAASLLLDASKIPLIVKAKNISRHWEVSSEGQMYQRGNEWNEHSRVWLLATPWTPLSMPGSSVHGILQARILQWVAISFSGDLPNPGIEPSSSSLQMDSLLSEPNISVDLPYLEPWF